MAKYTFRLDEDNPLHLEALQKIQRSGDKIQGFLLKAVLAYGENPLQGLPMDDIDKIANRIVFHMERVGAVLVGNNMKQAEPELIEEVIASEEEATQADNEPDLDEDIAGFLDSLM